MPASRSHCTSSIPDQLTRQPDYRYTTMIKTQTSSYRQENETRFELARVRAQRLRPSCCSPERQRSPLTPTTPISAGTPTSTATVTTVRDTLKRKRHEAKEKEKEEASAAGGAKAADDTPTAAPASRPPKEEGTPRLWGFARTCAEKGSESA